MKMKVCGTCRFFKHDAIRFSDTDSFGFCEFKMPDFIPKFDDESVNRRMRYDDDCSLWKKKKA